MMIVKGAVDVLLERMDRIRVGNTVRRMTDSDREDIADPEHAIFQRRLKGSCICI